VVVCSRYCTRQWSGGVRMLDARRVEVESRQRACCFNVSIDAVGTQSLQDGSQVTSWGQCFNARCFNAALNRCACWDEECAELD
jgi:hypothetical protein